MRLTVAFIVMGLLTFTGFAMFDVENWARAYALWDKGKDCLLLFCLVNYSAKKYSQLVKPIFYLSIMRLVWDGISWVTGLNINNTKVVGLLFLIYSFYVLYKTIKDVRK